MNKRRRNSILTSNVSPVRQGAMETAAAKHRNLDAMSSFCSVPVLSKSSVSLARDESNCPNSLGKGRFGSVYSGTFHKLSLPVAVKQVKSTEREVIAESKIYQALSGHHAFLYCFGLWEKTSIVLEYADTYKQASCLYSTGPSIQILKMFTEESVEAVQYMHRKGILHNDIKSDNVLCELSTGRVKLIDFGKACLLSHPKTYTMDENQRKLYNKNHRHLAHELRNFNGTRQSVSTDTYSLGYLFKYIGYYCKSSLIYAIGSTASCNDPASRISLEECRDRLSKLS